MTDDIEKDMLIDEKSLDFDGICEECKKKEDSVSHNLILIGFKVCNSCRTSKIIFPL